MSIYKRWINDELTQEDVKQWLVKQSEARHLSVNGTGYNDLSPKNEIDHVAMCLHHIYLWHKHDIRVGHFLTAVLKNNFSEACGRADDTNTKVLSIYAKFLYNCAPMSYKEKVKEVL